MQIIEVEEFIDAIRTRPAIWDSNSEEYKHRMLKKNGWSEVCEIMCPKYADMSREERLQMERDMQLKWKNLRDAYVRHIRMEMDNKGKSKPMKSYIYHNHMSFLRTVINPRTRTRRSPFTFTTQESSNKDETNLTEEDFMEMVEHDVQCKTETDSFVDETSSSNMDLQNYAAPSNEGEGQDSDDMLFFKSLLPTLKTLKVEQKLKFRIDVMELLMTYHQAAN